MIKSEECFKLIILNKYFLYFSPIPSRPSWFCCALNHYSQSMIPFVMLTHSLTLARTHFLSLSPFLFMCYDLYETILLTATIQSLCMCMSVCLGRYVCSDFISIIIFCPSIFKLLLFDSIKLYKLND